MKTNNLDNFEQFIKDTLSKEEIKYNHSDWDNLSKKLDYIKKPLYKNKWFVGGLAAMVLGIGTVVLYPTNNNINSKNNKANNIIKKEKPTIKIDTKDDVVIAKEKNSINEEKLNIKPINNNKRKPSETINNKENTGNREIKNHHSKPNSLLSVVSSNKENLDKEHKQNDVVIPKPIATFKTSENLYGCKGLEVEFSSVEQENVKYIWSFGDGKYSTEPNPTHKYQNSGIFKVDLLVQSSLDENIIVKSDNEINVTVYEAPKLEINSYKEINRGLTTIFYSYIGDEVEKVFWNLGNGETSKSLNPNTVYKHRGGYKILLEAENTYGCKSITEHNIFIEEEYNLLAPNTFTPDGDGLNDYFIPEALKTMNCNFTMVIRSRTEGIVFESTSLDRPWDGKNQKTGKNCLEANYVWVVNLINEKGEKEQYSGTIFIKR